MFGLPRVVQALNLRQENIPSPPWAASVTSLPSPGVRGHQTPQRGCKEPLDVPGTKAGAPEPTKEWFWWSLLGFI